MGLISRVSSRTYRKGQKTKKTFQHGTSTNQDRQKSFPTNHREILHQIGSRFLHQRPNCRRSRYRPNQALEKPDCRFHHPHHETNPKGTSSRYLHQTPRGRTRTTRQLRPRAICSLRAMELDDTTTEMLKAI